MRDHINADDAALTRPSLVDDSITYYNLKSGDSGAGSKYGPSFFVPAHGYISIAELPPTVKFDLEARQEVDDLTIEDISRKSTPHFERGKPRNLAPTAS